MGVDRKGTAYVVFQDGNLFKVSTKNASCEATDYVPNQSGFGRFGMGFALDEPGGRTDALRRRISSTAPSLGLATIDTDTLELSPIGPFSDNPWFELEMRKRERRQPPGFSSTRPPAAAPSSNRQDERRHPLRGLAPRRRRGQCVAFAFHGGEFTSSRRRAGSRRSRVTVRATNGHVVASLDRTVVGAGVSTCGPKQ